MRIIPKHWRRRSGHEYVHDYVRLRCGTAQKARQQRDWVRLSRLPSTRGQYRAMMAVWRLTRPGAGGRLTGRCTPLLPAHAFRRGARST